jgi:hypothetical protein
VILTDDEYFAHYGTPRHSGRYPWGSGGDEDQQHSTRNQDWLGYVQDLRKQGLTDKQIYEGMGIKSTEFRARLSVSSNERRGALISQAVRLRDAGNGATAIGKRMGLGEGTVRSLLKSYDARKEDILISTSNMLRDLVTESNKGGLLTPIDVGSGNENYMGISSTRLNTALQILKDEGYGVYDVNIKQVATGQYTKYKVLVPPGATRKDAWNARDNIRLVNQYSEDGGVTYTQIKPPLSISSDRVGIRYKEQGGGTADGVIYVREGVPDVSLGGSRYGQVRVVVDDTHYLKGVATYKDDLPDGADLVFNTSKSDTGNKKDAMKAIESDDPKNPSGAMIRRQILDENGKVSSVMNIITEEGKWAEWSNDLAAQMLSKQSPVLIRSQLEMTLEKREKELKELSKLTNPTVKRKLLESFASETDSAAVHLEAAGFKRQSWSVILPVDTMPKNQVYAPSYNDGEQVFLIRYPHGGTFEIPELTVNNNHRAAKKALGTNAKDVIGIHHSVAERLSGADFDGDTVLVIPKQGSAKRIIATPALKELQGFDPRDAYRMPEGMPPIPKKWPKKQLEMGNVSNLITDMTIQQAPMSEIARAVKHSMVIIDTEKHNLNYKQSALDNGIADLKRKYQQGANKGAATLISKGRGKVDVPKMELRRASEGGPIDRVTGAQVLVPTGLKRRDRRTGELVDVTEKRRRLSLTDDAHTLSSGTPVERLYADHTNKMKALANQARLEILATPKLEQNKSAKKVYEEQRKSLNAKLDQIQRNRPLERQAQVLANAQIHARYAANPGLEESMKKKIRSQALNDARARTGADRLRIQFTDKEWEAIQAGAIAESMLKEILDKSDLDHVRKLATPKTKVLMSSAKIARAKQMFASGATRSEVATSLGVSLSTLDESVAQGEE